VGKEASRRPERDPMLDQQGRTSAAIWPGTDAFTLAPRPGTPRDVQAAFLLWLAAVALGGFETALAVIDAVSGGLGAGPGILVGVAIRLLVFTVAVYLIACMRLGRNWARVTLAILLGGIGLLSLLIGPVIWLAEGHSVGAFVADADLLTTVFALSRVGHVACVIAALVLMFRPPANAYFRAGGRRVR
jgi:hypothetical protein